MEKVVSQVVTKTSSELILFFILVVVVVLVITIPLVKIATKYSSDKREQKFKREQLLIDVVKDNSSIIAKLTTIIESSNQNCTACKLEQTDMMATILAKQEQVVQKVDVVAAVMLDRKEGERNG